MSRRFNNKDNPISARRKLQFIKQYEDESLQEFAQRFYFITINGYNESGRKAVDHISTENFIMGCRDKEAARSVMEKNPKNIHEALDMIKTSIANQQAIYGTSKAFYYRQVSFDMSEQNTSDESLEIKASKQQKNIDQLEQKISKLTDMVFGMKQTIDENVSNSRASNISPQFQSRSRPSSPYRHFDRQGSKNILNRSLSPFRANVRSLAGSPFRPNVNKSTEQTNSPIQMQNLNLFQSA